MHAFVVSVCSQSIAVNLAFVSHSSLLCCVWLYYRTACHK